MTEEQTPAQPLPVGNLSRQEWLRYLITGASLLSGALFLFTALSRITYPFELEWVEGAMASQVKWLLDGHKLYAEPSLAFKPYMYPPLYFYVSAAFSWVFGEGYFPLRLVSLLSALGCFLLIYKIILREIPTTQLIGIRPSPCLLRRSSCVGRTSPSQATGDSAQANKTAGMAGAGLFAAMFSICGYWYDLARVDMLHYCLFLGGVYYLRRGITRRDHMLAGILFALSIFTKQTGIILAAPLLLHAVIFSGRRGWLTAGITALLAAAGYWFLDLLHDGWYLYYNLFAGKLPLMKDFIWKLTWEELIKPLPAAWLLAGYFFYREYRSGERSRPVFYLFLAMGAVTASLYTRLLPGGYANNLISAFMALALLSGQACKTILQANKENTLTGIALLAQFALLLYNPLPLIPSRADKEAGNKILEEIRGVQGEVFIPYHNYLAMQAGEAPHIHVMPLWEALAWDTGAVTKKLAAEYYGAIRDGRYKAIILDRQQAWFIKEPVEKFYRPYKLLLQDTAVFWPRAGMRSRPEIIFVYKGDTTFAGRSFIPAGQDGESPLTRALRFRQEGRLEEAAALFEKMLEQARSQYGKNHPAAAEMLNNLAECYRLAGKNREAVPLYAEAKEIWVKAAGPHHVYVGFALNNMALNYQAIRQYAEAEKALLEALAVFRSDTAKNGPYIKDMLQKLSLLYRKSGNEEKAEAIEQELNK